MADTGAAACELAIQKFGEILQVERLLDKKQQELQLALSIVPPEKMNFYVSETEQMRATDEELRGKRNLPAGR